MPEKWKRPESVPFPSIWSRFEGRKEINGVVPKFWVQDATEDLHDTLVEHMIKGFAADEPMCRHINVSDEPQSLKEMHDFWRECLKDKIILVCFMENPNGKPILAGWNFTVVSSKDDPPIQVESKKFAKVIAAVEYVSHMKDPFSTFGVDHYMSALGLYVSPEFRGQGLGVEILKARIPIGRAVGLKLSVTAFTATASQIQAERAGFKDLSVISYSELRKINPELTFPGIDNHTKELKSMYLLL